MPLQQPCGTLLSQGISCKKQRARSEDRHQIKPFPTAQLDETINLRYLTSLLFPEMGYATPIRNFYTSSGDKLDLKFAKIWHSIIPINSITKSWERLRCFTDTHQNNQTDYCRRAYYTSYWTRRRYNVGTRSGLTSTAERSSYCWLVPCTISNALRWQWIPRIGVIHKTFSSLQYFLRSLSNFIHPPHRSYPTRLSTICSRDLSHRSPFNSEVFVEGKYAMLVAYISTLEFNQSGFIELVYFGPSSAIYSWGFIWASVNHSMSFSVRS
jgi:hypothetical protein